MADLLKLNDYVTPAPTKYDVSYSNVNGTQDQTETGDIYIERIKSQKPSISVSWTNLLEDDVTAILEQVKDATIDVTYWFGGEQAETMTCDNQKMTLKNDNYVCYYDLSFTLSC